MFPVRYIPTWFPFAGFKRSALKWSEDYARMREIPFEYAVTNMVRVSFQPPILACLSFKQKNSDLSTNFVSKWVNRAQSPEELSNLKHTALIFFAGERRFLPSTDPSHCFVSWS